jgi:serine/threonine protein kinase
LTKRVAVCAPGELVAPKYRVVEHLSRGGSLDVYDVWSEERECRCIVKLPRPDRVDERTCRRLREEARLLLAMTHPHLVRAYALEESDRPVLVLETLTGLTLGAAFEKRRLRPREAAFLAGHLCSAIGYLHRHGVVHLDLKPDNVIAQAGLAKVLDLSLARPPGQGHRGVGTPGYMAPEQVKGGWVSEATDVWAIGALLYEALTGRRAARRRPGAALRLPRGTGLKAKGLAEGIGAALQEEPGRRPTVAELARLAREVLE